MSDFFASYDVNNSAFSKLENPQHYAAKSSSILLKCFIVYRNPTAILRKISLQYDAANFDQIFRSLVST